MYTTCRVGVLSSEISKHSKISPPPSLRSHLTSSPMGVLSGDYGSSIFSSSCGTSLFTNLYVYRHGKYSLNNCDCISMYCALRIHTMVVPRCGLHSITDPKPASSSILIALTAPSLFPLSRKRLATRRALIWRTFPGRRRQYAASERSSDPGQVLMFEPAVVDMCTS